MGKFDIDRPIAELFSVEPYALRIRNVCNSHDIATIRELCLHSNWDLLHFRHLGERSIAHMEEMLGNFGLRLGMTEEDLDAYMRPRMTKTSLPSCVSRNRRRSSGTSAGMK